MLELDGRDAGGQYVRTGVALSVLTGTPVRIENVRGDRPEPGLKSQHLAAVETLAELSAATVDGGELGATTLEFEPGTLRPGTVAVDVGTAGSLSLVFDAVLPLATVTDGLISISATGGTEVTWSPPLAYLERVKLPLLRRLGIAAAVDRERTGFYPAGGGRATLTLGPSTPERVAMTDRGTGQGVDVVSIASDGLRDNDVAERQAAAATERLADAGLSVSHETTTYVEADSPGTAIVVTLRYAETRAGFSALGDPGKPAEDVATEAVEPAIAFHESGAPAADRYLADQLLVFLAVTGGRVLIPEITDHVATSRDLLAEFGVETTVEDVGDAHRLAVESPL